MKLILAFILVSCAAAWSQGAMFFGGNGAGGTPPPFAGPYYTTNLFSVVATGMINTTGAKLIVIQCNSFGAGCNSGPSFGETTPNTYTIISNHFSGNSNISFYYKISPATGTAETWAATGTDTLYVSVYGPPTSGGTTWAPDSGATGYDTSSTNSGGAIATLGITPTVTHDIIIAGTSDNISATPKSCTIVSATDAVPIVFTLVTCNPSLLYFLGQPVTVSGVAPSAYNGSYTVTANPSGLAVSVNNVSAPGVGSGSGGTFVTVDTRYATSAGGGCAISRKTEYNFSSAKETGANGGTADCNSTSAQSLSWVQYTNNYIAAVVAFKPQ